MSDECGNVLWQGDSRFFHAGMCLVANHQNQRKMCYFWRLTYPPKRIEKNVLELAGSCDTYLNDPNFCTLCRCFVDFRRKEIRGQVLVEVEQPAASNELPPNFRRRRREFERSRQATNVARTTARLFYILVVRGK